MSTKMPPPVLCVNCKHYTHLSNAKPPYDHMCGHSNRYTLDLVTGKNKFRSEHPYYSTCEEQRAQENVIRGTPPRCTHRGDWFEAKTDAHE